MSFQTGAKLVLFALASILGLYLLYVLRSVVLIFFVAFIINAGLRPIVSYLEKRRVPRGLAILIVYLFIVTSFLILSTIVLSAMWTQIKLFVSSFDIKVESFADFINTNFPFLSQFVDVSSLKDNWQNGFNQATSANELLVNLGNMIGSVGGQGLSLIGKLVSGLLNVFLVIILSIYMIKNRTNVYERALKLLPVKHAKKLNPIFTEIENTFGSWLLGQFVLMLIIGVASYLIVLVPVVLDPSYPLAKYALVIAVIAGLLESVPNIGPAITLFIAVVIAIISGASIPVIIFLVIGFTVLQQLESIFIVPVVMKKAVNLDPIVSIIGVVAGFQLGGPIGALLAVPIMGALQIVVLEFSETWKSKSSKD